MSIQWSDEGGKNYFSKAKGFLKRNGDMIYKAGALGTVALSAPFMQKYADVFMGLPWQELTPYASAGFEAIGAGQAGQVMNDFQKDKEQEIKTHPLEYVGRGIRPAPLLAYPIAFATGNDARFALVLPATATVIGYVLEGIGKSIREKKEKRGGQK